MIAGKIIIHNFKPIAEKKEVDMPADRRAGKAAPHVGKQPRSRRLDGAWRKKRGDAGKKRS
jgi:hypothetical protein